jgi:hypothetical protein
MGTLPKIAGDNLIFWVREREAANLLFSPFSHIVVKFNYIGKWTFSLLFPICNSIIGVKFTLMYTFKREAVTRSKWQFMINFRMFENFKNPNSSTSNNLKP